MPALARRGVVVSHGGGDPEHFTLRRSTGRWYPVDFRPEVIDTIERVSPFTMTSPERLAALCAATEHVVRAGVPGSLVECGVWKGGSMMAVALTLQRLGAADRDLYLFDTYRGMTRPTAADVDYAGVSILDDWPEPEHDTGVGAVGVDAVRAALASTGYEEARLHYVEGPVEQTLPIQAPGSVALLRLDTDWYESTRHELEHLYPRLAPGGVLIVDDYGHLQGAQRATDEYFSDRPVLLNRIDYSGRLVQKPPDPGP